jgi:hypothetical protein
MSASFKESHNKPSVNCCTANSNGIDPNNRCGFVLALDTAVIPMMPNTALAPKLAVAEKHISWSLFEEVR